MKTFLENRAVEGWARVLHHMLTYDKLKKGLKIMKKYFHVNGLWRAAHVNDVRSSYFKFSDNGLGFHVQFFFLHKKKDLLPNYIWSHAWSNTQGPFYFKIKIFNGKNSFSVYIFLSDNEFNISSIPTDNIVFTKIPKNRRRVEHKFSSSSFCTLFFGMEKFFS